MTKKIPSAIVIALLSAFLSGHAVAVTEQEAHAQLDHVPAKAADARKSAHAVLGELVAVGVSVDQAYEVVRSAVEHNYSASDLRQIGAEMRDQIKQGIPSEHVSKIADEAIDAGNSASATQKVLDTFQANVEKGMPADQAYATRSSESGFGSGTGMGSGGGTGSATSMAGSFSAQGSGSGSGSQTFGGGFSQTTGSGPLSSNPTTGSGPVLTPMY